MRSCSLYQMDRGNGVFHICPDNPERDWIEEGLIAIAEIRGELYEGIYKRCGVHEEEYRIMMDDDMGREHVLPDK